MAENGAAKNSARTWRLSDRAVSTVASVDTEAAVADVAAVDGASVAVDAAVWATAPAVAADTETATRSLYLSSSE